MLNRLGVCGLVLLVAMGVGGCGSDAKPKADPKPSASPTAPPGLVAPEPKKPKMANTEGSAVEYGYYLARLVEYSLRIRSARPVQAEAFDLGACSVCRKLDTAVQDMKKKGQWQITPDLRLGKFKATGRQDGYTVGGKFVFPSGHFVKLDGTQVDTADGGKYLLEADLRWDATRSRWRVLDFTFDRTNQAG
jgi:hypothetical protein